MKMKIDLLVKLFANLNPKNQFNFGYATEGEWNEDEPEQDVSNEEDYPLFV